VRSYEVMMSLDDLPSFKIIAGLDSEPAEGADAGTGADARWAAGMVPAQGQP
jgi:hypothetical protein